MRKGIALNLFFKLEGHTHFFKLEGHTHFFKLEGHTHFFLERAKNKG